MSANRNDTILIAKRISPVALAAMTEALAKAFWYKPDLRSFLQSSTRDRALIAQLDWQGSTKRQIASQLIGSLAADQSRHLKMLLGLMFDLCDITDPAHLKGLEDGESKYAAAVQALDSLRTQTAAYRFLQTQEEEAFRRQQLNKELVEKKRVMLREMDKLKESYWAIAAQDPQRRGYSFETFLNQLFLTYDIDCRGPFRIEGEQIDGAFTLDNTEYLLEAKWNKDLTPRDDLVIFANKVEGKLENTLGLFISINGFEANAVKSKSIGHRPAILLMNGADLMAVLEDRIALPTLIARKRQHASRTGEILLLASTILS